MIAGQVRKPSPSGDVQSFAAHPLLHHGPIIFLVNEKRFVVFPDQCPVRFLERKAGEPGNFLRAKLVKTRHGDAGLFTAPLQGAGEDFIRETKLQHLVPVTDPARSREGKVSFGDENGPTVLCNERVVVFQQTPVVFEFEPGLAGAQDDRNISLLQQLEGRASGIESIGLLVKESAIEVSEDEIFHLSC